MLGAIIGDIVGSPYEFANTKNPRFPLFSKRSSFTDDTICTIAVADALVRGSDFGETLREWCLRYPNPMGAYGGSFNAWLHSDNPQPYNSWGNGAAMRVSPCGWAFDSEAETLRAAMASAAPTHNHVEGLIGASIMARAIYRLRDGHPFTDVVHDVFVPAYGTEPSLPAPGVFDETCQCCVPLAFYIVGEASGFEDAIRRAVVYGGDSDTLAAIVGSLAEALWGIPAEIHQKALSMLPAEMYRVLFNFKEKFSYENL
jgi:ADP-ribosylglycohydrolase